MVLWNDGSSQLRGYHGGGMECRCSRNIAACDVAHVQSIRHQNLVDRHQVGQHFTDTVPHEVDGVVKDRHAHAVCILDNSAGVHDNVERDAVRDHHVL